MWVERIKCTICNFVAPVLPPDFTLDGIENHMDEQGYECDGILYVTKEASN